jgi:hypothetical protein
MHDGEVLNVSFFMECNSTHCREASSMCLNVTPSKIPSKFLWNFISRLYTKHVLHSWISSLLHVIFHTKMERNLKSVFKIIPHFQNFYTFHKIQLIFTSAFYIWKCHANVVIVLKYYKWQMYIIYECKNGMTYIYYIYTYIIYILYMYIIIMPQN